MSLSEQQKAGKGFSSGLWDENSELPSQWSTVNENINVYSSSSDDRCNGIMGVPITFMNKYNPDQFEILGSRHWSKSKALLDAYTGDCQPPESDKRTLVNGRETYDRIFIRYRQERKK